MILKFTQKLLKDMKVTPVIPDDSGETGSLFSWHVNILQLKKKYIIFVNDLSRLCLIIEGIRSSQINKLQDKFREDLERYLLLEGVRKTLIDQYFLEAGKIQISKTDDKSVLGTMKEMTIYCQHINYNHTYDLSAWLNSVIYKPIGYEKPTKIFKDALGRYS
ncbi:hypothetical protein DNH61_02550 [Paenibacillus sambharensis]|uniref:DUF6933 domain-containing protein n=1 Tax=Paenibacillus sambharensis TaxID=1803190 RepID=A0A2W1LEZ9_9BACL|nr:hypothetical protein [Paenibacillus sambharensis]PZD97259.1 hypothetical protein DNH61_02550 [Paenibacillus sambharensis]